MATVTTNANYLKWWLVLDYFLQRKQYGNHTKLPTQPILIIVLNLVTSIMKDLMKYLCHSTIISLKFICFPHRSLL